MTPRIDELRLPRLREVLPRDGFQDFDNLLPTSVKVDLINKVHAVGCRWIEVTSFVHPRQVPQFFDAEQVVAEAQKLPNVFVSAFVPNRHGLQRALAADTDEVSLAVATTDGLAESNFRQSREELITESLAVAEEALGANKMVSITVGGAFGCPFEGPVPPETVVRIVKQILSGGVTTVLLADTIGAGTPEGVGELMGLVVEQHSDIEFGVHIHGQHGIDSVRTALDAGATIVDTSMGGFGGCPFVPDAPGNVDTALVAQLLADRGQWEGPELSQLLACFRPTLPKCWNLSMDNAPPSSELLPPLRFADLEEGRHFGPTMFETSPELVACYAAVTGDDNPVYRDDETSRRLGFLGPILPPGLTGVWARHAYLAGHRMLPGGVMAGLTIELVRPTMVGTTLELHAEIELVDRDHPKQRVVVRSEAYDREGLTARAWIDARWPPDNDKGDR